MITKKKMTLEDPPGPEEIRNVQEELESNPHDYSRVMELFAVYDSHLRSIARRYVRAEVQRRLSVDDVIQETFLRASRSFRSFDPERPLKPWLSAATINAARSLIRSSLKGNSRDDRELGSALSQALTDGRKSPSSVARAREYAALAASLLADLQEPDQSIVYLFVHEQRSHREIATILGMEYSAVRKRYVRALVELRNAFNRFLPNDHR